MRQWSPNTVRLSPGRFVCEKIAKNISWKFIKLFWNLRKSLDSENINIASEWYYYDAAIWESTALASLFCVVVMLISSNLEGPIGSEPVYFEVRQPRNFLRILSRLKQDFPLVYWRFLSPIRQCYWPPHTAPTKKGLDFFKIWDFYWSYPRISNQGSAEKKSKQPVVIISDQKCWRNYLLNEGN